jgi:hypothetical protein
MEETVERKRSYRFQHTVWQEFFLLCHKLVLLRSHERVCMRRVNLPDQLAGLTLHSSRSGRLCRDEPREMNSLAPRSHRSPPFPRYKPRAQTVRQTTCDSLRRRVKNIYRPGTSRPTREPVRASLISLRAVGCGATWDWVMSSCAQTTLCVGSCWHCGPTGL